MKTTKIIKPTKWLKIAMDQPKKTTKKKLTIAVGINSLSSTTQLAYSNHIQLFFRLGRNYPDINFCLINPPRMSIDRMRNMSAEVVLNQEFDYLMFLDDDVLVPFDCLTKLMACNADIASGDVLVRGYPFAHMSFRHPKAKGIVNRNGLAIVQKWKKNDPEIAAVDAVGFSLVLIKAEVLKSVNKPYFVTGPQNTEDIYFCMKARQTNPDLTIVTHRGIVCQHILWPEIIGPDNAKWYRTYYEKYYGVDKKDNEDEFRGKKYLKIVKGALDV